ncbi:MAG: hypothetical protein A3F84_14240 [Candidatus Handelsmanbacteria bacterium RIFCSPLOWO2_12_FULL_64_10]|uniref:EF-hand domain-containing protein n=1 Tax=Handelsmanbacteria sp. (strain RIFCSPLOWO2_12_FULL_64_10) TaxID=1817868 RepID=A0A1F6CJE0_HANXR|nr:MAG: hypothetical protein A3F84_14240 [Candidatus Handelsmanbacteria bacterium RIFCSPLOWO2_12_FULL_64_10]
MRVWVHALGMMLCYLLTGSAGAAGAQATAPLITLGVPLPLQQGLKATKIRGVKAGQGAQIEVFGEDVKGAVGFRAVIGYDSAKLKFAGFTVTEIIPGLSGLSLPDSARGTVEIGGASVEGTSAVDRGRLGVLRLEVLAGFSDVADVTLKTVTILRPEGRRDFDGIPAWKVSITEFGTGPGPGPAGLASDFDGNGTVDFDDFFAFADVFGAQQGDAKFNAKFDLNKNGSVDFDDFFIFAGDFGKTTK